MLNPLVWFDIIMFPIIALRLIIIYFYGSRYDIDGFRFLDVMQHAENSYFNQDSITDPPIDTIKDDVRKVIKYDSFLYKIKEKEKENENEKGLKHNEKNYVGIIDNQNKDTKIENNINNVNNDNNDTNESENLVLDTEIVKNKKNNSESSSDSDSNSDSNSGFGSNSDSDSNSNSNSNSGSNSGSGSSVYEHSSNSDNIIEDDIDEDSDKNNVDSMSNLKKERDFDRLIKNVKENVNLMMKK